MARNLKKSNKKGSKKNYNYSSILRKETAVVFFERFSKKLYESLVKYFGENEAVRVMQLLEKGNLKIVNPETYLYTSHNVNDESLELYHKCRSFEEFYYKSLMQLKYRAELGETTIYIREFFLVFADYMTRGAKKLARAELGQYIKNFLSSLIKATDVTPYIVQLMEPHLCREIGDRLGLNMSKYPKFLEIFVQAYEELAKGRQGLPSSLYFPKLEIVYPVYHNTRAAQEEYLATISYVGLARVKTLMKPVENLAEDTPALRVCLETLAVEAGFRDINLDVMVLELQRLTKFENFKTYPTGGSYSNPLISNGISAKFFLDQRVSRPCTNLELYRETFRPYFSNVLIDCSRLSRNSIEQHMDAAKNLSLLKCYYYRYVKDLKQKHYAFKITLLNVTEVTQDFVEFVKNKIKQMQSSSNMDFFAEVVYKNHGLQKKVTNTRTTHIRVISDIHADYNERHNYTFNFGDDFVVNCGDTGGTAKTCINWNRANVQHGVVVAGNHLGYGSNFPELDTNGECHPKNTKGYQIKTVGNYMYDKERSLFMSNSTTEYEGIVFIGSTLYTDFALYGEDNIEESMAYAKLHMNDFRYIHVDGHREYYRRPNGTWDIEMRKRSESTVRKFTPHDHAYFFHYSFNFIKEKVMEYSHKPIVVVTHHAPSPYSISSKYTGSMLNPAFVSDLNKYIVEHPEIRLWCHGHLHDPVDYILGETRVVCCPFGYNNENNWELPYEYGTRIAITDIKNKKKSWKKICAQEIKYGLIKVYQE